jgi:S1-C subfamily serine protease
VGDSPTDPPPAPPAATPRPAPRSGVPATDVLPKADLARYGLESGDLIQSVNGRPVASRMELARIAAELRGQPVAVAIARGDTVLDVRFTAP